MVVFTTVTFPWIVPVSDFLSDLKIMYPIQIMSLLVGKIITKQVFDYLFSNLLVKCWKEKKIFLPDHVSCSFAG